MYPQITPRIAAIKASKLAKCRPALAHLLAFATRYSIDEVELILKAAPVELAFPTSMTDLARDRLLPPTESPSEAPLVALETNPK